MNKRFVVFFMNFTEKYYRFKFNSFYGMGYSINIHSINNIYAMGISSFIQKSSKKRCLWYGFFHKYLNLIA